MLRLGGTNSLNIDEDEFKNMRRIVLGYLRAIMTGGLLDVEVAPVIILTINKISLCWRFSDL